MSPAKILFVRHCWLLKMKVFKLPLEEKQKRYLFFIMLLALLACPCQTEAASQRQNWYHDPFFQISDAISDCPKPAGPFVTESERLTNAHHRAERGTSCWLAGKCDRPSSYDYDQDIAKAFKEALSKDYSFKDSTLWVTVQGRVVFIEGCVREKSMSAKLEHFASRLPYVDIAVAHVRSNPTDEPPYILFDGP